MLELEKDGRAVSLIDYPTGHVDRLMPLEGRTPGVHALVGTNTLGVGGPPTRTVALLAFITDMDPHTAAADRAAAMRAEIAAMVDERLRATPEYAAAEAAEQRVNETDAKLTAAQERLAEAQARRQEAIDARTDPRPFRAAIADAQGDVDDLSALLAGLMEDRATARSGVDVVLRRLWRELADQYRAEVFAEWRELVGDVGRVVPPLVRRLLAVDACEKMLARWR